MMMLFYILDHVHPEVYNDLPADLQAQVQIDGRL